MSLQKILLGVLGCGALGVGGLAAYGLTLPTTWAVERSVRIQAAPEDLFPLLNSPVRWKDWAAGEGPEAETMNLVPFGPGQGVNAGYKWDSPASFGEMALTASDPTSGVAYTMKLERSETPASGSLRFTTSAGALALTWRDEGDLGMKPFGGYFVGMMNAQLGAHMDSALAALKRQAEIAAAQRLAGTPHGPGEMPTDLPPLGG